MERSEWTVPELQLAKGADEDAVLYLLIYATQYQLTMRLSQACMQIQVTARVCNDRHVFCGEKLKDIKTKIRLDPQAPLIKFKTWGCYVLIFQMMRWVS